jgi:hypothetical protein
MYIEKKRKKIRVEAASFLDERIVDMSAEILREAERFERQWG